MNNQNKQDKPKVDVLSESTYDVIIRLYGDGSSYPISYSRNQVYDAMEEYAAPLYQCIEELESEIEYLKYKKGNIADVLRGYVKHSKAKSEELEALNAKYREALELILEMSKSRVTYFVRQSILKKADEALNHNLKDNETNRKATPNSPAHQAQSIQPQSSVQE